MKSNRLLSIFRAKLTKWILLFLILGICIFLIWPASSIETDIFIPVKPENIPDGMTLSIPFPKGIDVRISGSPSRIKSLKDHTLHYPLDLSDVTIGDLAVPINEGLISLPPGVVIIKITPSILHLTVENESRKVVPVKVSLLNRLAAGYIISEISVTPASVTLKGPQSLLNPITEIRTKPIDINGTFESFKKETTLDLGEGVQNISPLETLLVEITLKEQMDTRALQDIPVKGLNTGFAYQISPSEIDIKIKGPVNVLDKLDPRQSIKAHIDLNELQPGIYMKPAIISLPVGITMIQVKPEIFTVEINSESASSE